DLIYVASGFPAPRYESTDIVFVYIPYVVHWAFGILYAPETIKPKSIVGLPGPNVARYAPIFAVFSTRKAVMYPSFVPANSTSTIMSRPPLADLKCSFRSSIHFTGRCKSFAAYAT